jgi:geranylgeranyl pyrophosphate synthase
MSFWSFVAAGGHLDDGAYRDVVRFAAALETLHMFALVHDDVMDQSPSRRGSPSAHVEAARWHADSGAAGDSDLFGLSMAILLGDLAHMLADHLIIDLPADQQRLWFDLCVELIVGQRADIAGAAGARRDRRHAEHIARLKSGRYSVERPLELGAVAAGARPEILAALQGYGEHLGRVFALRDDQLGIWGDPATTGKPIGDDLAEGKATVVMSLAADRLSGEAAEALQRLGTRDLRPGDVAVVTEALEACGIRDEVEALIGSELARALACLAESTLTPAGVAGLKSTAEAVAWRQS